MKSLPGSDEVENPVCGQIRSHPICQTVDMAEYSQAGLLAALLFFTALTVRDIYLGRLSPQRGHQPADSPGLSSDTLSYTDPGKPAKSSLYTGHVLKLQYW